MATKKAAPKIKKRITKKAPLIKKQQQSSLRFGESYTSLMLGIIVVIVGTMLTLFFVHSRVGKTVDTHGEVTTEAAAVASDLPLTVTPTPPLDGSKEYTVAAGDNLWIIAEKVYNSGYNWVDIARANNLSDPDDIHPGNKLVLPKVSSQLAAAQDAPQVVMGAKITVDTYKVVEGDTLWDIAVRAYGDGFQWTKLVEANEKIVNPDVIDVGSTLRIPRN